jgi:hypothetical protein
MYKIAVCISGQPRFFKTSYPMLEQFILSNHNCDIFIETWSYALAPEQPSYDLTASWRYKDEGTIVEYAQLYKPKRINAPLYTQEIDDYYAAKEQKYARGNLRDGFVKRYLIMLDKIAKATILAKQYAKEKGIEYDLIIRTRSDLRYKNYLTNELLAQCKEGVMLVDGYGNGRVPVGDVFAVGRPREMAIYSGLSVMLEEYFNANIAINTEVLLPFHLELNKIDCLNPDVVGGVIRPPEWGVPQ